MMWWHKRESANVPRFHVGVRTCVVSANHSGSYTLNVQYHQVLEYSAVYRRTTNCFLPWFKMKQKHTKLLLRKEKKFNMSFPPLFAICAVAYSYMVNRGLLVDHGLHLPLNGCFLACCPVAIPFP
jgi:hypothetical protein